VAEAEQEVAFALDHVTVTDCPNVTELAEVDTFAVGEGGELIPPPHP